MNLTSLTVAQLKEAIAIKEKIEALEQELALIPGTTAETPMPAIEEPVATPKRKKRKMSAATKAKMAASQKQRWAKKNGIQETESKPAIISTFAEAAEVVKASAKPSKPSKKAKGAKPAVTKERMTELLKSAGKGGITVKEVAQKLGVESQRIYAWFSGPGKTVKQIKKTAPAKYAWVD